jgi:[ribosomal protein S5]-alanine N-acetyltransferase
MLIGKNILLRPVRTEDAQLLADWYSDPEYYGYYYNIWPTTRQMVEHWIAEEMNRTGESRYLIVNRDNNEPMGDIGYWYPFSSKYTSWYRGEEIWYQVHPQFRNRGIATQAACLLINHLFDATPTERIQATVVEGNEMSCRVLERAGMQKDGIYRKVLFLHGRYVGMYLYAIVRDDWKDEESYRQSRLEF